MSQGARKAIGIVLILMILLVWIVGSVAIGERLPSHWAVQIAFYAVAGMGWCLPVMPLMAWMNRGPVGRQSEGRE